MPLVQCPSCQKASALRLEENRCPQCGAKVRETLEEMNAAIAVQQAAHSIKRARVWLLIAAGLTLAGSLMLYLMLGNDWAYVDASTRLGIELGAALGVVLLALWAWAALQPFAATLVAVLLYGGVTLLAFVQSPAAFLESPLGVAFRVFVLAALVSGVRAAAKHRQLTRVSPKG